MFYYEQQFFNPRRYVLNSAWTKSPVHSLFLCFSGIYRLSPAYFDDKRRSILKPFKEVRSENWRQGNGGHLVHVK